MIVPASINERFRKEYDRGWRRGYLWGCLCMFIVNTFIAFMLGWLPSF